jgi:hypothetical protein
LLSKGIYKNKKTMRSMVVVFYLQNWNKGINERSELPPAMRLRLRLRKLCRMRDSNLRYPRKNSGFASV